MHAGTIGRIARRALGLGTGLIALLGAGAASAERVRLDDPIAGTRLVYADVLRRLIPDLAVSGAVGNGHLAADLPHLIDGLGGSRTAPVDIERIETWPLRVEGKVLTLLLADFGENEDRVESTVLLALLDSKGKILDAADIGTDRHNGPATTTPVLAIGAATDAVLLDGSHSNSSQVYRTTSVVTARENRLVLVDAIFTFGERGCGYTNGQHLKIGSNGGPTEPLWLIAAVIEEERLLTGEACGDSAPGEEFRNRYEVVYRWDGAGQRWAPSSDLFEVLAKKSAERF